MQNPNASDAPEYDTMMKNRRPIGRVFRFIIFYLEKVMLGYKSGYHDFDDYRGQVLVAIVIDASICCQGVVNFQIVLSMRPANRWSLGN